MPKGRRPIDTLTAKEIEIIRMISAGMKGRDIAPAIHTTQGYLDNKVKRIFDKIGCVNSRLQLALWWLNKNGAVTAVENETATKGRAPKSSGHASNRND